MDFNNEQDSQESETVPRHEPATQNIAASQDRAASLDELVFVAGERRKGERRQRPERRAGIRGCWEERRLLERRGCNYSVFGNTLDGTPEALPNDSLFELEPQENRDAVRIGETKQEPNR